MREVAFCMKMNFTWLTVFAFHCFFNLHTSRPLIGSHGWLSLSWLVQRRAGCRAGRCGRFWAPSATRPMSSSCVAKLTPRRSWTFPCSSALSVGPLTSIRAQYLPSVILPPPMVNVSDPYSLFPGFWWPKIGKKFQLKLNYIFFWSKIAIYLSLGLHKGRPSYRRSLQPSKVKIEHPAL